MNDKRREILEHIIRNPGIHFNGIVSDLKISKYVAVWHLELLKEFKLIKKLKLENRDLYYDGKLKKKLLALSV